MQSLITLYRFKFECRICGTVHHATSLVPECLWQHYCREVDGQGHQVQPVPSEPVAPTGRYIAWLVAIGAFLAAVYAIVAALVRAAR